MPRWSVAPTVFRDGIIAGIDTPQCAHCGRWGLPLVQLGTQTLTVTTDFPASVDPVWDAHQHDIGTQYTLVCGDCMSDALNLLEG